VKKEQNGTESLRRLKLIVDCNASKIGRRRKEEEEEEKRKNEVMHEEYRDMEVKLNAFLTSLPYQLLPIYTSCFIL